MGDTWIPEDVLDMKPLIRNFFENTSTVQVLILSWDYILTSLTVWILLFSGWLLQLLRANAMLPLQIGKDWNKEKLRIEKKM